MKSPDCLELPVHSWISASPCECVVIFRGPALSGDCIARSITSPNDKTWVVESQRIFCGSGIKKLNLAQDHYRVDLEIAARGGLDSAEYLELLRIYDRPAFLDRHGQRPQQLVVLPALQLSEAWSVDCSPNSARSEAILHAARDDAFSRDRIRENSEGLCWNSNADRILSNPATGALDRRAGYMSEFHSRAIDAPNWVGDRKVVSVFEPPSGPPLFLVNQHVAGWRAGLESEENQLHAFHIRSNSEDEPIQLNIATENDEGFLWHVSRGPIEAVRDLWNWFGVEPLSSMVGRKLLVEMNLQPQSLLDCPYIDFLGRRRVTTELTAGLSIEQSRKVLQLGQLADSPARPATDATIQRINLAYEAAQRLREDPCVMAVIATGSVAMNRSSADSDLDLAIITRDRTDRHIEAERLEGIAADLDWLPWETALRTVDSGEPAGVKDLREAARLAFGLPIYESEPVILTLRERATAMRPDQQDVRERLASVFDTLADLADHHGQDAERSWEALRGIHDNLAFLALLLHPLRYHKPKWVPLDLAQIGNRRILEGLFESYRIDDSQASAERAIAEALRFICRLTQKHDLPDYEEVLAMGYTRSYAELSYACRCLADAQSLLADCFVEAAQYAALFAMRLAVGLCPMTSPESDPTALLPLDILSSLGDDDLMDAYRSAFRLQGTVLHPLESSLIRSFEAATDCREQYERAFS